MDTKNPSIENLQIRFDLVSQSSSEGLWDMVYPANGMLLPDTPFWWSDQFRKILGFSNENDFPNILSSWASRLHPNDRDRTLTAFGSHLNDRTGKTGYDIEYQLQMKTGDYRWFRARGFTMRDAQGNPLRVAGSLQDITDERKRQAELQTALIRFDLVSRSSNEGLWDMLHPSNGMLLPNTPFWWSDQFRKMLGYQDENDFPNVLDSWASRLHPDDKDRTLIAFGSHLNDKSGKTGYDIEYQLKMKSGEYRWFRAKGYTMRNEEGNPLRVAGSLRDITDERTRQSELQTAVVRFNLVSRGSNEGLWDMVYPTSSMLQPDTPFWWSDQFRKMLGFTDENDFPNILDSWASRLHPNDKNRTLNAFGSHLNDKSGNTAYDIEYQLQMKTGEYRWFRAKGFTMRDYEGNPLRVAGSLRDITDEKKHQAEMKEAQGKLISSAKLASLGEMSAGIAHEINNPLAIIDGTAKLLPKFLNNPEKLNSKLDVIYKSCERISKIVMGLKKFSRSGDKVEFSMHSLSTIIKEVVVLVDNKSKRYSTPIIVDFTTEASIKCNEIEIEQVLINLISNGIDAVQTQTDKWVKISAFEDQNSVVLRVTDSGDGIPANVRVKLFEPFFTTKKVGEGTGLGLSIAKGILDEHKATISVLPDSPNTCFEIRFPRAEAIQIAS